MIHGHVVSAVERYLASVCINRIVESPDLMRKLLESDPDLEKINFTLKSYFPNTKILKTLSQNI